MSLFTNVYSTLITKGLGGDATAIILAKFHLTTILSVIVTPPVGSGGGGGWSPNGGFYVPLPKSMKQQTRMVLITVKINEENTWRRSYVIHTEAAAKVVIKMINFADGIKSKILIGVDQIKTAGKRVTAIFSKSDK
jgi:hypothetical protein